MPKTIDEITAIEKAVRKIERNLSDALKHNRLTWDEMQQRLDANYALIKNEKLNERLLKLYGIIPQKQRASFKKKIDLGIIKISNIEMLDSMPIFLENRPEQVKEHLNDLSAQIIFCFYANCLIVFARRNQIWETDIQRLVERYKKYRFNSEADVQMNLPWGKRSAGQMGMARIIDWHRLSKWWADYMEHKTQLRKWNYDKIYADMGGKIYKVLTKVPAFGNTRAVRLTTVFNLDQIPEYWNWTCQCQDFVVQKSKKRLVVCHHVAAIIWKLMDEGKIKKPWER